MMAYFIKLIKIVIRQIKCFLVYPLYFLRFAQYLLKWKRVVFLPFSLDIEPSNNCNFNCPHCQVAHWHKQTAYLNLESFGRILDILPSLVTIKLQGMGEPLLNKELIDMLKLGVARGISMSFITNGSVYSEEIGRQLVELTNTQIFFSVDGGTSETFEKIRVGGKFETVKNNLKNLVIKRGHKKSPIISIWCVVTNENIGELTQIVELAKELGVDSLFLQVFLSSWGKSEMNKYLEFAQLNLDSKEVLFKLSEAKMRAKELEVKTSIYYGNLLSKKRKCSWLWRQAFISAKGDVVPCCRIADSDTVNLGNVFIDNFAQIWYSDRYRDFRYKVSHNNLPEYCKYCYIDEGVIEVS